MYVIEWLEGKVKQYYEISYKQQLQGAYGRWYREIDKGFKYKTRGECAQDIVRLRFMNCHVVSLEDSVGKILSQEIKKNLLDNIKVAKKELTKDEYVEFLDILVMDLALLAEDCTHFLDKQLDAGTNALPIVAPVKKKAAVKKVATVARPKARKKAVKKRVPKKKVNRRAIKLREAKKKKVKKKVPKKKVANNARWG